MPTRSFTERDRNSLLPGGRLRVAPATRWAARLSSLSWPGFSGHVGAGRCETALSLATRPEANPARAVARRILASNPGRHAASVLSRARRRRADTSKHGKAHPAPPPNPATTCPAPPAPPTNVWSRKSAAAARREYLLIPARGNEMQNKKKCEIVTERSAVLAPSRSRLCSDRGPA